MQLFLFDRFCLFYQALSWTNPAEYTLSELIISFARDSIFVVEENVSTKCTVYTEFNHMIICNQLPLYRIRRDLYYLLDITDFRYKESDISVMKALGPD